MKKLFLILLLCSPLAMAQKGKIFYYYLGPNGGFMIGEKIETGTPYSLPGKENVDRKFLEFADPFCFTQKNLEALLKKVDAPPSAPWVYYGKLTTSKHQYYFVRTAGFRGDQDQYMYDEKNNFYAVILGREEFNQFIRKGIKKCSPVKKSGGK